MRKKNLALGQELAQCGVVEAHDMCEQVPMEQLVPVTAPEEIGEQQQQGQEAWRRKQERQRRCIYGRCSYTCGGCTSRG